MNKHTPGPLKAVPESKHVKAHLVSEHGEPISTIEQLGKARSTATAKLSAAAYSQYDKVAREWLGVDATELAEKMDLLTILREWAWFVRTHGTYGTLEAFDGEDTRTALADKFNLKKVLR
jgi:hypothetical protein